MKVNKIFGCIGILAFAASFAACSSDNDDNNEPSPQAKGYTKGTDGGLVSSDGILFNEDGSDNPDGTQIGNGDQGFVFKGNTTLKKELIR